MDWNHFLTNSFDVKFALSALYLWLLFGYLSSMVSCDLQRWMMTSGIFRHFVGIISFLLLFTVLDTTNSIPVHMLLLKTFVVYIVFVMMTKSKWYFALPVLILIVVDQLVKVQVTYLTKKNDKDNKKSIDRMNFARQVLSILIGIFVISGFIAYIYRQQAEFGDNFSYKTLIMSSKCNL